MTALADLRRAAQTDIPALVTLQRAAYARNRDILGVEPLPLIADYDDIFANYETWLAEDNGALLGVLILEPRPDDLLIWSVATSPAAQGRGLGNRLLAAAETRARQLNLSTMRLYTGQKLVSNVAWYQRHGYAIERIEERPDRTVVHMVKPL
jgi:ribosomal protein S18 acetylase RimI-like enzyme